MHANVTSLPYKKMLLVVAGAALFLTSGLSHAAKTEYPLTIKNCGRDMTFHAAPKRVATVGQNSTEILYALGLADRVVGTSLWFGPVPDAYKAANDKIAVIAQNIPSFEGIIAKKPDLVASQFEWQIGPAGTVASYEQFSELKVPVYTAPADCAKDNEDGGDGVRKGMFDIAMVYQEVADLARIFDVQDKGEELIASLKARETAAKSKIAGMDNSVSAVFWFSSADLQLDPYVAGKLGPAAWIAQTLGIKNVIDSAEEWPTVGWETIAKAQPTVIVLGEMSRRRFPADDWQVKMDYLKSDPVTQLIPAVKADHLPVIDVQTMNAGIRTIDGVEKLADALVEYGLAHPQAAH
ncbi:TPA: ABC transporter substrate-binding protein [Citrobacter amalonaticus]|uniref:ABC transporter substrate-binding protein n=1 Tax=Citrobacter amalonaticus TaxID=35703 RepID=UPI0007335132|nr:ABC transporter substrate-binding protein [Citrobacter amalonaticus]EKW3843981.1 ABC transporter substrate-binding protein [Citrobacter amalonaticus]EKW3845379.1 ABC transporter substrate-binding protein [Citrobacter amalonaticus]EKX8492718.1 ABC transporter substrate-binding protein [Citrobacter amalonaticus]ELO0856176.1 ABC transporter substrate-binding protein [Citrobacter amalonaticus]MDV0783305.1 ABC transporter substrate-binding protein [Citrobacter amalonaticus]